MIKRGRNLFLYADFTPAVLLDTEEKHRPNFFFELLSRSFLLDPRGIGESARAASLISRRNLRAVLSHALAITAFRQSSTRCWPASTTLLSRVHRLLLSAGGNVRPTRRRVAFLTAKTCNVLQICRSRSPQFGSLRYLKCRYQLD